MDNSWKVHTKIGKLTMLVIDPLIGQLRSNNLNTTFHDRAYMKIVFKVSEKKYITVAFNEI